MRPFDDFAVGAALGPLDKAPITTTQLVQYAGASGDFNRIHYDEPFAKEGGFPSVIAHGMLTMAFFGQLLGDAVGPAGIARLEARFKAVTLPGDVVTVSGHVTARDEAARTVEVALAAHKRDGTVTVEGSATLRFPTSP